MSNLVDTRSLDSSEVRLYCLSHLFSGNSMTQTIVDQRGRVLIPEEVREGAGLDEGTIVRVERRDEGIMIKPVRRGKRTWKQLCGLAPKRTGKPEWPTAQEIKSIWR
jgi:AbrB family looped-hinge helix DNA binding protein